MLRNTSNEPRIEGQSKQNDNDLSTMFVHYTISEDRSGDRDAVYGSILARLGDRNQTYLPQASVEEGYKDSGRKHEGTQLGPHMNRQMLKSSQIRHSETLIRSTQAQSQFKKQLLPYNVVYYLDRVKFLYSPEVYDQFLDVAAALHRKDLGTLGAISRIARMFEDHPALIEGFHIFLPFGHKIKYETQGDIRVTPVMAPDGTKSVIRGVLLKSTPLAGRRSTSIKQRSEKYHEHLPSRFRKTASIVSRKP